MTVQAAVGSTFLAAAVGVGVAGAGTSAPVLVAQTTQTLALTGASNVTMMTTAGIILVLAGALINGLSRRHSGAGSGQGPPLTC